MDTTVSKPLDTTHFWRYEKGWRIETGTFEIIEKKTTKT
jgi:hypothetical protein